MICKDLDVLVNTYMPGAVIYIEGVLNMIGHEMHEGEYELFEEYEYESF